ATRPSRGKITPLKKALSDAVQMANLAFNRDGNIVGVTSGFHDIDAMLGGFHPSDLIILAGRPAMGKTALATNIAYNAARHFKMREINNRKVHEGARVLFFSLEMSATQLANRILSEATEISSDKIRRGAINQQQFNQLSIEAGKLFKIPLYIDDTPALSVSAIRQRARQAKRTHGLELIVIDYLQLIQPPQHKRFDGRVQEVSEITRALKNLAKELDVPVITLSQLSRQVEQREDKRPHLADLRESGSIEQDADVVCFIYRHEYYLSRPRFEQQGQGNDENFNKFDEKNEEELRKVRNLAELIIAKQRHGPIGAIDLHFAKEFTKFSDLVNHQKPPHGRKR
ncbi:MAG: replicative DNA helicase, partial [Pseudomonadota bacterium]